MKIGTLLPCSALALLFLPACGGSKPAPAPQGAGAGAQQPGGAAQQPGGAARRPMAPVRVDMVNAKALFGVPPAAPPVDNPSTPEKVALGKLLYHEKSLSKNGNISCASCHDLANYGQDGKPTSPGTDGKNGDRNTPTVWNAFRQFAQFWDGRAATVEEQAVLPVLNPVEHGVADEAELVTRIKAVPALVEAFGKAFPGGGDAVTAKNFGLAVGAFERTLATKSPFEKFLAGDQGAVTNEVKAGYNKFVEVGCPQCHMSDLFGGSTYQKTGVKKPYPTVDVGRMAITKSESDKFMFKVPTLLNVEKTAPYYHDGKIATLEDAVANMAELQLGLTLKPEDVASIVTFLKALTGPLPELK
ncbi:MAG: cytochrome-c peroxidase [Planctomycetes bacterium]|nr:cytochrome-c peroxidase [Planctomycetota bacterium]